MIATPSKLEQALDTHTTSLFHMGKYVPLPVAWPGLSSPSNPSPLTNSPASEWHEASRLATAITAATLGAVARSWCGSSSPCIEQIVSVSCTSVFARQFPALSAVHPSSSSRPIPLQWLASVTPTHLASFDTSSSKPLQLTPLLHPLLFPPIQRACPASRATSVGTQRQEMSRKPPSNIPHSYSRIPPYP